MLKLRPARWPQDIAALAALDTELVTEQIYRPVRDDLAFRVVEEDVDPPLRKRYPLDAADPQERQDWDFTAVAEEEGELAGFAAAQHVAWNRRVVLWHLYVAPAFRRQGVGSQLLYAVEVFARSVEARCVWLETQNVNVPAIRFYRHYGFQFCGFDEILYDPGTLDRDEIALFFVKF